ncbi:uncharacterized protein Z518_02575 [Rhinocladiella mackenziei CBS 650.93]|uniref:GPI-anchored wall transfer protein n=1 Tax=Rhinocladiella mackenziei CBS 650.93 TaxID=1442369 RepID=A0A0D2IX40_9EURO|nr:uncharacterized protein Z518_02575 [Rhinocladiella mackenziei CBS 650.93]KIX07921.1 hypothetical protein Z518_02575 [Rhinocladiella mackenziei CBS 650.93]
MSLSSEQAPSAAAAYKARKEAFVSHLSGSSLIEINLVTLVAGASVLLWTALQKRQSFFTPYTLIAGIADFLLNICAILFAITIYSSAPLVLSIFLTTPALFLLFLNTGHHAPSIPSNNGSATKSKQQQQHQQRTKKLTPSSNNDPPHLPVRPFLTHYRGSMLIATCLAILAVDFPIFPRRFAKVETWGTSLMDLGVGSFVFSAGVVSARTLVKSSTTRSSSFTARFLQVLRHSTPLFILGFIRLWSVKGLDYAEHVTEYGVHWNFFFTLALLPPFVELSDLITHHIFKSYDILALVLALAYELLLTHTTLLEYILISPRGPDLLSMNREGIFSFIGYLAIYLAGRGTGGRIVRFNEPVSDPVFFFKKKTASKHKIWDANNSLSLTRRERQLILLSLLTHSLLYSGLYWLSTSLYMFNLNVSRRLANLPYVLWIVAFNNAQLLLFGLIEDCGPSFSYEKSDTRKDMVRHATSRVLRTFNTNGLIIFLVANLLTGLVNLTVNTLDMSPIDAMGILMLYALVLTGLALGLDYTGVKIKV